MTFKSAVRKEFKQDRAGVCWRHEGHSSLNCQVERLNLSSFTIILSVSTLFNMLAFVHVHAVPPVAPTFSVRPDILLAMRVLTILILSRAPTKNNTLTSLKALTSGSC